MAENKPRVTPPNREDEREDRQLDGQGQPLDEDVGDRPAEADGGPQVALQDRPPRLDAEVDHELLPDRLVEPRTANSAHSSGVAFSP